LRIYSNREADFLIWFDDSIICAFQESYSAYFRVSKTPEIGSAFARYEIGRLKSCDLSNGVLREDSVTCPVILKGFAYAFSADKLNSQFMTGYVARDNLISAWFSN
jgi:hypothetical protein